MHSSNEDVVAHLANSVRLRLGALICVLMPKPYTIECPTYKMTYSPYEMNRVYQIGYIILPLLLLPSWALATLCMFHTCEVVHKSQYTTHVSGTARSDLGEGRLPAGRASHI